MVVATWNLENLFRPGHEFGPTDERAYDEKLSGLAGTIGEIAPDALALQEVGEPEALDDLRERLDGAWESRLSEFPDERGIRVGFLLRSAPTGVEELREFPEQLEPVQVDDDGDTIGRMGRGALRVRVPLGSGEEVDLITCHLKSKLVRFPGGRFAPRDEGERARYAAFGLFRRAAEALTVRMGADGALAGRGGERPVVVLGDLNDEPPAATTQLLLGPPGSEIGTPGFDRPDQGDASRLWNLAPLIPAERRFSRIYRGRRELIDQILVSRALVTRVGSVDTIGSEPASIEDDPRERRDEPLSDHLPVVARFTA